MDLFPNNQSIAFPVCVYAHLNFIENFFLVFFVVIFFILWQTSCIKILWCLTFHYKVMILYNQYKKNEKQIRVNKNFRFNTTTYSGHEQNWNTGLIVLEEVEPVFSLAVMSEVRRNFMVIQALLKRLRGLAESLWELRRGSGRLGEDWGSDETRTDTGWRVWHWSCCFWRLRPPAQKVSTWEWLR